MNLIKEYNSVLCFLYYATVKDIEFFIKKKEVEYMNVKGLYKVKQEGLLKIASMHPNIPAVKRHIKNPDARMQFSTAHYLSAETNVPIHDILEIPHTA